MFLHLVVFLIYLLKQKGWSTVPLVHMSFVYPKMDLVDHPFKQGGLSRSWGTSLPFFCIWFAKCWGEADASCQWWLVKWSDCVATSVPLLTHPSWSPHHLPRSRVGAIATCGSWGDEGGRRRAGYDGGVSWPARGGTPPIRRGVARHLISGFRDGYFHRRVLASGPGVATNRLGFKPACLERARQPRPPIWGDRGRREGGFYFDFYYLRHSGE